MDQLGDLYQQLILDHNAKPRNYGHMADSTHHAHGHNPLCGDEVGIYLNVQNKTLFDIRFDGQGCAICKASASLMTESLRGKSLVEADAIFSAFHHLLTDQEQDPSAQTQSAQLGKLQAFAGVRAFPMRVKCATLAWHTMRAALQNDARDVTTESDA